MFFYRKNCKHKLFNFLNDILDMKITQANSLSTYRRAAGDAYGGDRGMGKG